MKIYYLQEDGQQKFTAKGIKWTFPKFVGISTLPEEIAHSTITISFSNPAV